MSRGDIQKLSKIIFHKNQDLNVSSICQSYFLKSENDNLSWIKALKNIKKINSHRIIYNFEP